MNTAILDSMIKAIGQAYATFDSLQISVTALLIGLVIVSLGFFFALREAISWFLKIDDIKKDVRRLSELVLAMEGEVRVVQTLLTDSTSTSALPSTSPKVSPIVAEPAPLIEAVVKAPAQRTGNFRINH